MNRGLAFATCVVLAMTAPTAMANPDTVDSRLVTRAYDPDQVVTLNGKLGVQATVGFAADEKIENVAVGDSQKWQITPNKRANLLFVKPLQPGARTNMTVVTDKRTYFFDLVASAKARPIYMLRFSYADDAVAAETAATPPTIMPFPGAQPNAAKADTVAKAVETKPAEVAEAQADVPPPQDTDEGSQPPVRTATATVEAATPQNAEKAEKTAKAEKATGVAQDASSQVAVSDPVAEPAEVAVLNFAWRRTGDPALLPLRIYDDGKATFISWTAEQTLPAILTRNDAGEEGPVNFAVHGTTIMIDDVPALIVLRSGDLSATLENMAAPAT